MVEQDGTRHRVSGAPQKATKETSSVIRLPRERLGEAAGGAENEQTDEDDACIQHGSSWVESAHLHDELQFHRRPERPGDRRGAVGPAEGVEEALAAV